MKQLLILFLFVVYVDTVILTETLRGDVYVSNGGSDTNTGTSITDAWQTIAKVNAVEFLAGDTIFFHTGDTWRETLTVPSSGSDGSPIVFTKYDSTGESGADPIISGGDIGDGWTNVSGDKWYFTGLSTNPNTVVFRDTMGTQVWTSASVDTEKEWFWTTSGDDTLFIYSSDTTNIEYGARSNCVNITNYDYIILDNLTLQTARFANIQIGGTSDHITVQSCTSRFGKDGVRVQGSTVGGGNIIQDNEIHYCFEYGVRFDDHILSGSGTESYVRRNNINNNHWAGIELEARYVIVESNIVTDNGSVGNNFQGIHLYGKGAENCGDHCIIRYNKVSGQGGTSPNATGIMIDVDCDTNEVYYNIVYESQGGGIAIYGATDAEIYNNSVYDNGQNGTGQGEIRIKDDGTDQTTRITVKNNIGYATQAGTYSIFIDPNSSGNTIDVTNNLWYSTQSYWYVHNVDTGATLATWNGKTGVGTDLNNDPLMVNPTTDFTLQSTSPCINTGTDVGLTTDYAGNTVPFESIPDMGAYEYQLSTATDNKGWAKWSAYKKYKH